MLAVGWSSKNLFFIGVADKTDFREDRRHGRSDEHDKRSLFNTAIRSGALGSRHCSLNTFSKFTRLRYLLSQDDSLYEIRKFVYRFVGPGVFPGCQIQGFLGSREIQKECFNAPYSFRLAGVCMDRNKQVGFLLVGDRRTRFKRYERVVVSRHHDFRANFSFYESLQPLCNIQYKVFFGISRWADASRVFAAVTGINDNATYFQPQASDQSPVPQTGGLRRGCHLRARIADFVIGFGFRNRYVGRRNCTGCR